MISKLRMASRDEVKACAIPANAVHNPIAHNELLELVEQTAARNGLKPDPLSPGIYQLAKSGNQLFAEISFEPLTQDSSLALVIGITNALDNSKKLSLAFGIRAPGAAAVFYAGAAVLPKRSAASKRGTLSQFLEETVNEFIRKLDVAKATIKHWTETPLSSNAASSHVFGLEANKALSGKRVLKTYWNFAGKISHTVFEFFNSVLDKNPNPFKRLNFHQNQVKYFQNTWSTEGATLEFSRTRTRKPRAKAPETVKA